MKLKICIKTSRASAFYCYIFIVFAQKYSTEQQVHCSKVSPGLGAFIKIRHLNYTLYGIYERPDYKNEDHAAFTNCNSNRLQARFLVFEVYEYMHLVPKVIMQRRGLTLSEINIMDITCMLEALARIISIIN